MFIGLEDFDIDIFLKLDDENIYIYYIDIETIPELSKLLPLGSFEDGRLKFTSLRKDIRFEAGLKFLIRDTYAEEEPLTGEIFINVKNFVEQFQNLPEVMAVLEPYLDMCDQTPAPSWCMDCSNGCPDYCRGKSKCATRVPVSVFSEEDLYFIIIVYFNGIYRTSPEEAQNFGPYDILTGIDFELNKYSLIVNIQEFFTKEFSHFLGTVPGCMPFACDFGTTLKLAVQTKNNDVLLRKVEDEVHFFIRGFNKIWGDLVTVQHISIDTNESNTGADSWTVNVYATIQKERLIYRIEV